MVTYVVTNDVNGTFNLPPGTVNDSYTSLTLLGQGAPVGFGQYLAQNTVSQLCNFAGPNPPGNPLIGQIWYNSSNSKLEYLNGPGSWISVASESWVDATYALKSDLANYESLNSSTYATKESLTELSNNVSSNYATITEVNSVSSEVSAIQTTLSGPISALGTPGTAGTIPAVNSSGNGYVFSNVPALYYQPIITVSSNTVLTASQINSVVNISASGISVVLPTAASCKSGTSFTLMMMLASGVTNIFANSADKLMSSSGVAGSSYALNHGESVTFISDGVSQWTTTSQYKNTCATMPAGDKTTALANTAFVASAVAAATPQATESTLGISKVATQTLVSAGVDDTTFVTPKKLAAALVQFSNNISSSTAATFANNGYVKLSNGLIFQWGRATTSPVTFPIVFPNACFSVVGTLNSSTSGVTFGVGTPSTSQFVFYNGSPCTWFAIGY